MNRFLKLLGYRDRNYHGEGFSVHIVRTIREGVDLLYKRQSVSLTLLGERYGRGWHGIDIVIPQGVEPERLPQIVNDLETAFRAMGYDYVISCKGQGEPIPEQERQAAVAELREMGYEIEFLPDGRIHQMRRAEGLPQDRATLRKTTARMMTLIQSLPPTRHRIEILGKSKES